MNWTDRLSLWLDPKPGETLPAYLLRCAPVVMLPGLLSILLFVVFLLILLSG